MSYFLMRFTSKYLKIKRKIFVQKKLIEETKMKNK